MATDNQQTAYYTRHYKQLELDDRASWEAARTNYRRLVHLWHPDRFAQRPRERIHAQQQFIDITKSYNALRNFHRTNQRLPFESAQVVDKKEANSGTRDSAREQEAVHTNPIMDSGVLGRDPADRKKIVSKSVAAKLGWLLAGGTIMFGTILLFLVLDRNATRATAEIAREVVKETPQSEFLPSAAEIRRSQTRGAFVKPTK